MTSGRFLNSLFLLAQVEQEEEESAIDAKRRKRLGM